MTLSTRAGFGSTAEFTAVTQDVAGVRTVLPNVGVGLVIPSDEKYGWRLTKLSWRVDLAPDVPPGTVISPTAWRLLVCSGKEWPSDIRAYQRQAFPLGAHPEIPDMRTGQAALDVLWDEWLNFSNGDPGLNSLASETWPDAGPSCSPNDALLIMLTPLIVALDQTLPGAANALITIAASGAIQSGERYASLPRY